MKPPTIKREPTPAERQKRAVGVRFADDLYARFVDTAPRDPTALRWARERLIRLMGAETAVDLGEGALHCALNGAIVAGAPAYRGKPRAAAASLFRTEGDE